MNITKTVANLLVVAATWSVIGSALQVQKVSAQSGPSFHEYAVRGVPNRQGRLALIERWTDAESQKKFNKRVRRAAGARPTFAGRYAVVAWSCGWICANLVIVDVRTRMIYDTPFVGIGDGPCPKDFNAVQKGMIDFRLNSRLLIVRGSVGDPLPGKTFRDAPCSTRYYVWQKDRLVLLREILAMATL